MFLLAGSLLFPCLFASSTALKQTKDFAETIALHSDSEGNLTAPLDTFVDVDKESSLSHASDHLLVKTSPEETFESTFLNKLHLTSLTPLFPGSSWRIANFAEGISAENEITLLRGNPLFEAVDYDYEETSSSLAPSVSDNPLVDQQSYLKQAKIPEAWQYMADNGGTPGGDSSTVVAVIDTGVDYTHPDLADNMWINTNEIPGNNVDDDGNGYVDDYYGYNFVADPYSSLRSNPMDDHGHGTYVAGVIAAENNSFGTVGVAYRCKIMALKAGNASGNFLDSDIVEAVTYAKNNGADVINMSFGGNGASLALFEALQEAYSKAVLVAGAGNDARPNEGENCMDFFPASLTYVIGVMSENSVHAESSFTNYDSIADDSIEYDLYAPGESIMTTAPHGRYAYASGTSLSTPIVSGTVALLRSLHPDKDQFSSKYLMAQIIETSTQEVSCIHPDYPHNVPHALDAYNAFSRVPDPLASFSSFMAFDSKTIDSANNGDGVINSGETLDLGVSLYNKGGLAKNVTCTLDVKREGDLVDPYFTFSTASLAYMNIGTYSVADNGYLKDSAGAITGVANPFVVKVSSLCPDDYACDINVRLSWGNGLDASDSKVYDNSLTPRHFTVTVHHGILLPNIISSNTTLSGDELYIIQNKTIIDYGVTLTLEPGCKVQWGLDTANSLLTSEDYESIQLINNGTLIALGTKEKPISFSDSRLLYFSNSHTLFTLNYDSTSKFDYCDFVDVSFGYHHYGKVPFIRHSHFSTTGIYHQNHDDFQMCYADEFTDNRVEGGGLTGNFLDCERNVFATSYLNYSQYYSTIFTNDTFKDNVIFSAVDNGNLSFYDMKPKIQFSFGGKCDTTSTSLASDQYNFTPCTVSHNAYLGSLDQPGLWYWYRLLAPDLDELSRNQSIYNKTVAEIPTLTLDQMYWGNVSDELKDLIITDYSDNGTSPFVDYTSSPWRNDSDFSTLWPFVKDVTLKDSSGTLLSKVSGGTVTIDITFSRSMDVKQDLEVSFGSVYPYEDHAVSGSYTSSTLWEGHYSFDQFLEGGEQYFSIRNGAASDDKDKVLLPDLKRFAFSIDRTNALSMDLTATPEKDGGIRLSWKQNDYETLMGYNLYRSASENGNYTRINSTLVPLGTNEYVDQEIVPGQTYYYVFTVVLSDFSESVPSSRASAVGKDTSAPKLVHTAVGQTYLGSDLVINCQASDNLNIASGTLYYRSIGETAFHSLAMALSGSNLSAKIPSSAITLAGLEYYIVVSDGTNETSKGSATDPFQVVVKDATGIAKKGDVDGDGLITAHDAFLILQHIAGKIVLSNEAFQRADLNGDGALSKDEALRILQFVNGTVTTLDMSGN